MTLLFVKCTLVVLPSTCFMSLQVRLDEKIKKSFLEYNNDTDVKDTWDRVQESVSSHYLYLFYFIYNYSSIVVGYLVIPLVAMRHMSLF